MRQLQLQEVLLQIAASTNKTA